MTTIQTTNISQSSPITPQLSTTFDDSLVAVLNLLSGKKHTVANLSKMKITEDILYATLIYDGLKTSSPSTAKTFAKEIKERFDRRTARQDKQPLAKAIDDILDNAVDAKQLTTAQANTLISESFGKAQLDKSKSALSRSARGNGIEEIKAKISNNQAATAKTTQKFETLVEKTEFLIPSTARRQSTEFSKVIKSLTLDSSQSPSESPKGENPKKTTTNETDKASPLPSDAEIRTGLNDFEYKPVSEKDGESLVRLPLHLSKEVKKVDYWGGDTLIETLRHTGTGDDGRRYFRSSKKGSELPNEITVRLSFTNGTELDISVLDTKRTYTRSYSG